MQPDLDDTVERRARTAPPSRPGFADLADTVEMGTTTRRRVLTEPAPPLKTAPPPRGAPLALPAPERLFRVRIGGEQPIGLIAPLLIGRQPRRPRIPERIPATLVKVASPHSEISATHIEVRQIGAAVVLRDQRSSNGSRVSAPGRAPRLLSQGESMVVPAGTTIDLGDGVTVEVLAPAARPEPDPTGATR